jgi:hypothetical protein
MGKEKEAYKPQDQIVRKSKEIKKIVKRDGESKGERD